MSYKLREPAASLEARETWEKAKVNLLTEIESIEGKTLWQWGDPLWWVEMQRVKSFIYSISASYTLEGERSEQ